MKSFWTMMKNILLIMKDYINENKQSFNPKNSYDNIQLTILLWMKRQSVLSAKLQTHSNES